MVPQSLVYEQRINYNPPFLKKKTNYIKKRQKPAGFFCSSASPRVLGWWMCKNWQWRQVAPPFFSILKKVYMLRCKRAQRLIFTPFLGTFLATSTLIFALPGFLLSHSMTINLISNTGYHRCGFIDSRLWKNGKNTMKMCWKMMTKFLTHWFSAYVVDKVDDL